MEDRRSRALVVVVVVLWGCNALTGATDLRVGDALESDDGGGSSVPSGSSGLSDAGPSADGAGETKPFVPDDAGELATDAMVDAADGAEVPTLKRVFATSVTYTGNLGGLAGADAKCNELAQGAGLGGTFVAWLSTDATFARDRVTGQGPWYLVGQTDVAVTKDQLAGPPLSKAIRRNESGATALGRVWTGTNANGSFLDDDCSDWMSSSAARHAAVGDATEVGARWTAAVAADCSEPHRLYCFEL